MPMTRWLDLSTNLKDSFQTGFAGVFMYWNLKTVQGMDVVMYEAGTGERF